jgi:hypothetical protein
MSRILYPYITGMLWNCYEKAGRKKSRHAVWRDFSIEAENG